VLLAVLALSADVARANLAFSIASAIEVSRAPVRHQSVHDEVELDRAVVRRKFGWEE
jgi:hypothetical protein